MEQFDLNRIAENQGIDVKILSREHPDERMSRLKLQETEARQQLQKDSILFATTIGVVAITFCVCVFVILSGKYAAETEKTMLALLTLVIGGLVGYLTGKTSK